LNAESRRPGKSVDRSIRASFDRFRASGAYVDRREICPLTLSLSKGEVAVLILGFAVLIAGCATYTDRMRAAAEATSAGDYAAAVAEINSALGVDAAGELPTKWRANTPLAILERGVLLQSLEQYPDSARNFTAAEQELEMLDLSVDPVGAIGSYVYSDSAKTYKAPPSERLALNAFNLLNYLALNDLENAAVEARRFQVMRDYLESENIEEHGVGVLGAYLAGFVFDRRGEGDRALRYYEEALAAGPLQSLEQPAARLAAYNPYRGPQLKSLLAAAAPPAAGASGEVLVVLNLGRVAHKIPERIPVGAAIGIAGASVTGDVDWLTRGVAKVVVYPELVSTPSRIGGFDVRIDGHEVAVEELIDLDAAVRREYEEMKPKIIAAALTRLATRAALAEGVRAAGNQESDALGAVLGVVVEGAMVAFDRPDTRSWTTMPAQVYLARVPVVAGRHDIEVAFEGALGAGRKVSVDIREGGFAVVVVTEPR
jgi:tetratricopeptide (TPR) repeat protein